MNVLYVTCKDVRLINDNAIQEHIKTRFSLHSFGTLWDFQQIFWALMETVEGVYTFLGIPATEIHELLNKAYEGRVAFFLYLPVVQKRSEKFFNFS